MRSRDRSRLVALLFVLLLCIGWQYHATIASIVDKWQSDAAFSHGVIILPLSLWLAWRKRAELGQTRFVPSWWGVLAMLGCVATWVLARGTGVLVIEQFAVVAMVPAAVLAVLGVRAAAVLAFPLGFLLFAVPAGRGLVPVLMQLTAEIGTWALKLTGIPVYRSHMFITIPAGEFEVARTCSGLNYFVTGLVLGVLYAYLTYAGWKKRLLCVLAFIAVPILANGLRVYVTILVSHLTDMHFGPGTEHVTFGRIFFVLVMLLMFWIGRRWRDDDPPGGEAPTGRPPQAPTTLVTWPAIPASLVLAVAGPSYLASFSTAAAAGSGMGAVGVVSLPAGQADWHGPVADVTAWRPAYKGAISEQQAIYRSPDGSRVDVYVGLYGLGTTAGAEMIRFENRLFPAEGGSLAQSATIDLLTSEGARLAVREVQGRSGGSVRLVWQWFVVGDRPMVSPYAVKAHEALALVTRGAKTERVIALSTTAGTGARERLQSFVNAHPSCVLSGFAIEACGG
jgi:exosortase A